MSEQARVNISRGKTGKKLGPLSEETKRKMSLAHRGVLKSEAHRAAMRIAQRERRLKETQLS